MNYKEQKSLSDFKKHVRRKLVNYYNTTVEEFNNTIIDCLIYNEKTRIVAIFKEHLILDDISEFLRRLYKLTKILYYR